MPTSTAFPSSFPATPFWTGGQSMTSRMECLSLFLEMQTVMQITSGSDEKQHDLKDCDSARVSKRNNQGAEKCCLTMELSQGYR